MASEGKAGSADDATAVVNLVRDSTSDDDVVVINLRRVAVGEGGLYSTTEGGRLELVCKTTVNGTPTVTPAFMEAGDETVFDESTDEAASPSEATDRRVTGEVCVYAARVGDLKKATGVPVDLRVRLVEVDSSSAVKSIQGFLKVGSSVASMLPGLGSAASSASTAVASGVGLAAALLSEDGVEVLGSVSLFERGWKSPIPREIRFTSALPGDDRGATVDLAAHLLPASDSRIPDADTPYAVRMHSITLRHTSREYWGLSSDARWDLLIRASAGKDSMEPIAVPLMNSTATAAHVLNGVSSVVITRGKKGRAAFVFARVSVKTVKSAKMKEIRTSALETVSTAGTLVATMDESKAEDTEVVGVSAQALSDVTELMSDDEQTVLNWSGVLRRGVPRTFAAPGVSFVLEMHDLDLP